jgi:hypothetical protein
MDIQRDRESEVVRQISEALQALSYERRQVVLWELAMIYGRPGSWPRGPKSRDEDPSDDEGSFSMAQVLSSFNWSSLVMTTVAHPCGYLSRAAVMCAAEYIAFIDQKVHVTPSVTHCPGSFASNSSTTGATRRANPLEPPESFVDADVFGGVDRFLCGHLAILVENGTHAS